MIRPSLRLNNWTKPFYNGDTSHSDIENCIEIYTNAPWDKSWAESECSTSYQGCPCRYPKMPVLRLRGLCPKGYDYIDWLFTPMQNPGDPDNMILVGQSSTSIEYDDENFQWILKDTQAEVTAKSNASKESYLLGKHNWTMESNYGCVDEQPYTTTLTLTGCKEHGEFTCDNGHCIQMEERCNQLVDCQDGSDEKGTRGVSFCPWLTGTRRLFLPLPE